MKERTSIKEKTNKEEKIVKKEYKKKSIKTFLRLLVVVVGIVLFLWFLMPFTVAGILNIGNITGMLLAILLVLYVGFMPRIHRRIKSGWERKGLRRLIALLGSLILLCGILVIVETGCMIGACNKIPVFKRQF